MDEMQRERPISLEKELSNPKVVIVGHAGSGKSTFLSRMAFELCRNLRGACPSGAVPFLNPEDKRFPILVRIADFAMMLEAEAKSNGLSLNSEQWIPRYLGRRTTIEETFFRKKLEQGGCLVMLDGLDEAPNSQMRERIARLFENTTKRYPKCDYLVSTRPQSYEGDTVLEGFQQVRIGDLERPEIHVFLNHFSQALELNEREAKAFRDGLEKALDDRIEIREMGRNPLMLTALAVLQHGGAKLPEYRYELYESILGWLVKAREDKEGRLPDKQCLQYLRRLALAMQDFKEGRLRQINRREAAELLAHEFGGTVGNNEDLLERETHDSGIISSVGKDLQFWHLSLQEYLAAKEISGLTDANQIARVVKSGKLYRAEWREMMRLLGGVLCGEQGAPKIEGLFRAILKQLGREPALVEQARCAALLGAMMRDLSRMGYEPKTPDYERTVKAVMRIFDAATDRIDIRIRIEAADVLGQVGDPRLEDDNWVTIPTGTFYMGAQTHDKESRNYDPEAHDNESPVHEMELKGFRIRRFPVTVQEFGAFIKDKGYEARKYWGDGYGLFDTPADWERQIDHLNRPVVGVSWFEAAAYSAWAGGRLPTEAEWERVARGPQGGRYPWCDEAPLDPSRANYARQVGHPTPVGLYPQGNTAEGLCDMLGNVWEWCDDWFIPYHESPTGPKAKDARVWRGGSWSSRPLFVRVSNRYGLDPTNRHNNTGFRCAQTE